MRVCLEGRYGREEGSLLYRRYGESFPPAYEGDMEAVEGAIQAVLAACKEFEVVCGVTAGVEDIAERLEEGWGMIIVTEPAAVAVGRMAAGRDGASAN